MSIFETKKKFGRICKHFAPREETCAVGLSPIDIATGGKLFGWLKKAPRYERNKDAPICDKRELPTWDEVKKESEDSEKSLLDVLVVIALIPEKGNRGTVECPKCKGVVHWTRSAYNGHRHAKCETDNCLAFME